MDGTNTWSELVKPIVARFEVAAAIQQNTTFNADGSAAMAKLMKIMAAKLDEAVVIIERDSK